MATTSVDPRLLEIAQLFLQFAPVEAVVLSGSATSGMADERSDCDLYVYWRGPVPPADRERVIRRRSVRQLQLHRTFWEWEDAWVEEDGKGVEVMYRDCGWTEGEVAARLDRAEAAVGYSTCVLFSLQHAQPLVDPNLWFNGIQRTVQNTPYPDALALAIVGKNLPVLGEIHGSYEDQIRSARAREDAVSLNHRTAAWLASYFDILFAANRRYHPGEKRLLRAAGALPSTPSAMAEGIRAICAGSCDVRSDLLDRLAETRSRLEGWLDQNGLRA